MTQCPCCGHEIAELPVQALAALSFGYVSSEIVKALVQAYPRAVTRDHLLHACYGGQGRGPEGEADVLRVLIRALRRRLAPLGWTIPHNTRGAGHVARYRLAQLTNGAKQ